MSQQYVSKPPALEFSAMSRRQRLSKAQDTGSTYDKILSQAMVVLAEDGFDRFNVQRVLDGAEVSRATLYRYFPDVDGLIETALVENFRQVVDLYLNVVRQVLQESSDLATFRAGAREILMAFSTIPAVVRMQRAHTLALGASRPTLAHAIAQVQETLTDGWATTLQEAQHRGFIRAELDTRALAVFIQSMTLGRIVDDAAMTHISNELWANMFFEFVERTIIVVED
jgi:AcrR family transcriptional regulator